MSVASSEREAIQILRGAFPARPEDSRKGDFGRVVVAGGSERYAGVLAFNALAALRAGADVAIIVAPARAADLAAAFSPDLITIPCESAAPDPGVVAQEMRRAGALVLGGGVSPSNASSLLPIIRACDKPMVLDAGALHAIAPDPSVLQGKQALLTPNGGEFEALTGRSWPADEPARRAAAEALARARAATVLVKGRWDVISDGARTSLDAAGSSFLTKGGHGDVLAGACGALLARGLPPYEAARAGALLVGRAGMLAAAAYGESTLASDVLAQLPKALQDAL